MIESAQGCDLWSIDADAYVITTNGTITRDGRAVMGRGCALEAKLRFPDLDRALAHHMRQNGGNVVGGFQIGDAPSMLRPSSLIPHVQFLFTFPVKHEWHQPADLALIERSARALRQRIDDFFSDGPTPMTVIAMPRPGCGNGRLQWAAVRPVIAPHLDDRFVIVHK